MIDGNYPFREATAFVLAHIRDDREGDELGNRILDSYGFDDEAEKFIFALLALVCHRRDAEEFADELEQLALELTLR